MPSRKIILRTNAEYTSKHEVLLTDLYSRRIELFCVWGKHAEAWETAMDWFLAAPERVPTPHHMTTTSHPSEAFEEVMNMATHWHVRGNDASVEVIDL